jgi:hypothetical protein
MFGPPKVDEKVVVFSESPEPLGGIRLKQGFVRAKVVKGPQKGP